MQPNAQEIGMLSELNGASGQRRQSCLKSGGRGSGFQKWGIVGLKSSTYGST